MKQLLARATIATIALVVMLAFAGPGYGQSGQGCSRGFWKNHTALWSSPYSTTGTSLENVGLQQTILNDLFNLGWVPYYVVDWLSFSGGPSFDGAIRIFLREFVAALLNAAHPNVNFGLSPSDVVAQANDTMYVYNYDRDQMLAQAAIWEIMNNRGCPLN